MRFIFSSVRVWQPMHAVHHKLINYIIVTLYILVICKKSYLLMSFFSLFEALAHSLHAECHINTSALLQELFLSCPLNISSTMMSHLFWHVLATVERFIVRELFKQERVMPLKIKRQRQLDSILEKTR